MHEILQDPKCKVLQIKPPRILNHYYLITGVKREVVDTTRFKIELNKVSNAVKNLILDNCFNRVKTRLK